MLIARYDETYSRAQTLREHSEGVAKVAEMNLAALGLSSLGALAGWLHDLCKALPAWQRALASKREAYLRTGERSAGPLDVPHAPPSAQVAYGMFFERARTAPERACLQALCMAIFAHHGYLMDALTTEGVERFQEAVCERVPTDTDVVEAFYTEVIPRVKLEALWAASAAEMVNLLQKFRQAVGHVPAPQKDVTMQTMLGFVTRSVYGALVDADRLDAATFEDGGKLAPLEQGVPPWADLLNHLETQLKSLEKEAKHSTQSVTINQVRSRISAQCKDAALWPENLLALHAPTGGGKTLAGLRFALARAAARHKRRVFYVVSYTTILDQVYGEYKSKLDGSNVPINILLHHSNIIPDDDAHHGLGGKRHGQMQGDYGDRLAERWDADIILTTQVQFFNALFLGTGRAARRMRGLQDAVIILDEVQTVPPRLTHLFTLGLTYLVQFCNCDVLLSSATQPVFEQMTYPLPPVRNIFGNPDVLFGDMRRVRLVDDRARGPLNATQLAQYAAEKQVKWGNVLVVLNTRTAARRTYDALRAMELQGVEIYLLSNNLCPAHRKKVIEKLHNLKGRACICISTQLIECGVDLSFACAIRSLAGADNIWQTAGRCNRHGEGSLHPVYIVLCSEENLDMLKDIQWARDACTQSLHTLQEADALQMPSAMVDYYKRYYHQLNSVLSFNVQTQGGNATLVQLLSLNPIGVQNMTENARAVKPRWPMRHAFGEAGKHFEVIDAPTTAVIVPYHEGARLIEQLNGNQTISAVKAMLKKAQLYTINIYSNMLYRLAAEGAIHATLSGALAIAPEWYDSRYVGLLEEPRADPGGYIVT